MIRISLPWMLNLSASLDRLDDVVTGQTLQSCFFTLFQSKQNIEAVLNQSVYSFHLRSSRQKGDELQAVIDNLLRDSDLQKTISDYEAFAIKDARDQFKLVFLSEISTLPVFLVTRKESYDVSTLVTEGYSLFPLTLLTKAPETYLDAMEVGKALAFELGTACGFHAFRVTESVVKRYWDQVTDNRVRPNLETLGTFGSEMEKGGYGDAKIVQSIRQMARLHRNPIAHPEVILSPEEAIGIVGIARSVIGAMLAVLPDVPATTSTSVTEEEI